MRTNHLHRLSACTWKLMKLLNPGIGLSLPSYEIHTNHGKLSIGPQIHAVKFLSTHACDFSVMYLFICFSFVCKTLSKFEIIKKINEIQYPLLRYEIALNLER